MSNKIIASCTALILGILAAGNAGAQDGDAIRTALNKVFGPDSVDTVSATPVNGISEVVLADGEVLYASPDGRYVLQGSLVDLQERRNLTEDKRGTMRAAAIDKLDEADMVVYTPAQTKHTITVFTDPDCPYCRRLHQEVPQLVEQGVKVRYLAFPRAGAGSPTFAKTVSIWCAENRNAAMDTAKAGGEVQSSTCENPVEAQYKLGVQLGVRGTPTIITGDGQNIPGYVPLDRLLGMLNKTP